jgi:hypothetical protein
MIDTYCVNKRPHQTSIIEFLVCNKIAKPFVSKFMMQQPIKATRVSYIFFP